MKILTGLAMMAISIPLSWYKGSSISMIPAGFVFTIGLMMILSWKKPAEKE